MGKRLEKLSEMPLPEKAAEVRRLRAEGVTWAEIRAIVAAEVTAAPPTEEFAPCVTKRDGSLG